jgi:hypothetical protein
LPLKDRMNDRIKQLYEQAHIERRQEYFSSVVDPTIKSVSVTRHFDPDLFAELIVEEVYDYILNATFDDEPWPSRKDVKQHFGVEE